MGTYTLQPDNVVSGHAVWQKDGVEVERDEFLFYSSDSC